MPTVIGPALDNYDIELADFYYNDKKRVVHLQENISMVTYADDAARTTRAKDVSKGMAPTFLFHPEAAALSSCAVMAFSFRPPRTGATDRHGLLSILAGVPSSFSSTSKKRAIRYEHFLQVASIIWHRPVQHSSGTLLEPGALDLVCPEGRFAGIALASSQYTESPEWFGKNVPSMDGVLQGNDLDHIETAFSVTRSLMQAAHSKYDESNLHLTLALHPNFPKVMRSMTQPRFGQAFENQFTIHPPGLSLWGKPWDFSHPALAGGAPGGAPPSPIAP